MIGNTLAESPPRKRLKFLVSEHRGEDAGVEVAKIIAEMEIERQEEHADYLVDLASVRFPEAVAMGLLRRVREGRELPRRATETAVQSGLGARGRGLAGSCVGK